MIGILLLFGLVTKNSILLVDYANQLRAEGIDKVAAMRKAAPIRMRPVLMTAISMIFGVLPAALGIGPGAETRAPMAIATAAGMTSSMLLTLLVVPVFYLKLDDGVEALRRLLRRGCDAARAPRGGPTAQRRLTPALPDPYGENESDSHYRTPHGGGGVDGAARSDRFCDAADSPRFCWLRWPAADDNDDRDIARDDEITELKRKLDVVVTELETLRTQVAAPEVPAELESQNGLGPAASKVYGIARGVSIGGYAEGVYRRAELRRRGRQPGHVDLTRVVALRRLQVQRLDRVELRDRVRARAPPRRTARSASSSRRSTSCSRPSSTCAWARCCCRWASSTRCTSRRSTTATFRPDGRDA